MNETLGSMLMGWSVAGGQGVVAWGSTLTNLQKLFFYICNLWDKMHFGAK